MVLPANSAERTRRSVCQVLTSAYFVPHPTYLPL